MKMNVRQEAAADGVPDCRVRAGYHLVGKCGKWDWLRVQAADKFVLGAFSGGVWNNASIG